MDEINRDLESDFLENEKFDFDLAFSPIDDITQGQITKPEEDNDDEEVFFGPVGFTEQCVATRAKSLQDENNIKPLSPLTGEQVVEIFKEATKVVLRLEKLSSENSPVSSSSKSSLSSSILKLSNSSDSPCWLTGKLSSKSSEGMSASQFDVDSDKENVVPSLMKESESNADNELLTPDFLEKPVMINNIDEKIKQNGELEEGNSPPFLTKTDPYCNKNKQHALATLEDQKFSDESETVKSEIQSNENVNITETTPVKISSSDNECGENRKKVLKGEVVGRKMDEDKNVNNSKIPAMAKARGSNLPRLGVRTSKLPKSKNTEKSQSAFNSPIRTIGSSKKRGEAKENSTETRATTAFGTGAQSVEKVGTSNSTNSKLQKSVPAKLPQDSSKVTSRSGRTLAKRKIFNSTESLDKLGTKDSKSKLPVSEQTKIPAHRPRRRRSSSLSSLDSSQSSASSQTSQDDNSSKLVRPSTKIPATKASLVSSSALTRRSKLQDTTAEKKPQPMKALPQPGFASSAKNSKADATNKKPAKSMSARTTEKDSKDDKIPLTATPRSSSSLPVARRRSSFKSSLSSTSSREGSPPKYSTPRKPGKLAELTSSSRKRRSTIPTPGRSAPSSAVSRRVVKSSGDDSVLSLSPTVKPKKNQESARQTNRKLISDDDPRSTGDAVSLPSSQTVDDLLGCDTTLAILGDVLPMQPKPVAQPDLIDLSSL